MSRADKKKNGLAKPIAPGASPVCSSTSCVGLGGGCGLSPSHPALLMATPLGPLFEPLPWARAIRLWVWWDWSPLAADDMAAEGFDLSRSFLRLHRAVAKSLRAIQNHGEETHSDLDGHRGSGCFRCRAKQMGICSPEQNKRAFLGLQHSSHLLFPSFPSQHAPELHLLPFFSCSSSWRNTAISAGRGPAHTARPSSPRRSGRSRSLEFNAAVKTAAPAAGMLPAL